VKIAQVLTRGDVLGGAQTHVRELSLELRLLGHEVTVLTGAPGVFTGQLRQEEIPWLPVKSLVHPLRPHLDGVALVELAYALHRLKPDLVCAHTAKAGSLARAAARMLRIPSVFTPHGWSMFDRVSLAPNRFFCYAERLAGRLGTRVINVCEFERTLARQYDVCASEALDVVHNGIAELALPRVRAVGYQPPILVMVARFAAQKDHGTLLDALSGLLGMEWRLLLVGAGDRKPAVAAQVASLGLGDRVSILPAETNVVRLLTGVQVFVLSTHFEALPISILEAMRAGLPVVATDVGGISESVRHEQTGLLVPPDDVQGLREALARVIADPALRMALGSEGQRFWASHFTARAMAARTVEVYQRALASHPHLAKSERYAPPICS
jgi:glycosyltransferase involved in cell wall biosynthesis